MLRKVVSYMFPKRLRGSRWTYSPSLIAGQHRSPLLDQNKPSRETPKFLPYSKLGHIRDGEWYCNCNCLAIWYVVRKGGPNRGKRCKLCRRSNSI